MTLLRVHFITKKYTVHMMPVSKNMNGVDQNISNFCNNSAAWWVNKFKQKFSKVEVIDSSWEDHISIGKWFVCYK